MAITSQSARRLGSVTVVTAVSSLTPPVYFHWYLDGAYLARTSSGRYSFSLKIGEQARVEVIDTVDPDFDPLAAPPAAFPARATLHWVRSLSADVKEYKIVQGGVGGPVEIARIPHDDEAWDYRLLSDRLVDLLTPTWLIYVIDRAGNEGLSAGTFMGKVVRVPDAPRWGFTYDAGTDRVTFIAA